MDGKTNKTSVLLLGRAYHIKGDIDPTRLKMITEMLDDRMRKLAQSNYRLSTEMVAVLTALNTLDEYLRLKEDYEELMELIKEDR
ncbi:MAG: cell division protein ZapA [Sporomusaceae bacterium]|nr:cell division protein ZapA [Sporomusaceae bacterium]